MSLCINPTCPKSSDPVNANNAICRNCGSELLLQKRYRVISLLSQDSGFSKVYEALDRGIPKILKVLRGDLNVQTKAIELFQKEAEVLRSLKHPGIPKVEPDGYFTFLPRNSEKPFHCLVMEKIDGLNLEEWMNNRDNRPITQEQAIDWLKQITQILDKVHQQDYFHRDIKPPNIMRRHNGQLVLIDFGTAREVTGTYLAKIAKVGNVTKITSAGYTPPEQEKGHAVPQSDFYALGRTFVYLLTGVSPSDGDMYDPYNDELHWRKYAPQISPRLADFIDYLMAPKAGNRPPNTQVILQHLADIERNLHDTKAIAKVAHQPQLQPLTYRPLTPLKRLPSKSKNKWVPYSVMTLLGLAGSQVYLHFGNPIPEQISIDQPTGAIIPRSYNSSPEPLESIDKLSVEPIPSDNNSPESVEIGGYRAFVTSPFGLSVRENPSADANWLDVIKKNDVVVVLEESLDREWQRVRLENGGLEGWIKAGNIERIDGEFAIKGANTAQFPIISEDKGVTFKVRSVRRKRTGALILNVSLKNEGLQPVQFMYGLLNVSDERGRPLSASINDLPNELPATGEEFYGTIIIPTDLVEKTTKISLMLTDYPEQNIQLQILDIPLEK